MEYFFRAIASSSPLSWLLRRTILPDSRLWWPDQCGVMMTFSFMTVTRSQRNDNSHADGRWLSRVRYVTPRHLWTPQVGEAPAYPIYLWMMVPLCKWGWALLMSPHQALIQVIVGCWWLAPMENNCSSVSGAWALFWRSVRRWPHGPGPGDRCPLCCWGWAQLAPQSMM